MPHDTAREIERLRTEFEKQSETLEALFALKPSSSDEIAVSKAALAELEELCAVRPKPSQQPPMFGTRC